MPGSNTAGKTLPSLKLNTRMKRLIAAAAIREAINAMVTGKGLYIIPWRMLAASGYHELGSTNRMTISEIFTYLLFLAEFLENE